MQTAQVLERYRHLFGSLPHSAFTLPESDISAAQQAARTPETWRTHFLSCSGTNLRRALSHALLDSISARNADDAGCEPDMGIMDGDDGGYTTPASLLEDERIADASVPCYALLGAPASHCSSSANSLAFESTSTVLLAEQALEHLYHCQHSSSPPETDVLATVLSEMRSIVTKTRTRELRHPQQFANSLQHITERQSLPAIVRQQLETSISAAKKCAQACRDRALVCSKADALTTGLLSANQSNSLLDSKAVVRPPRKRPRAPAFFNAVPRPDPPASLEQILGPTNIVPKNVYCLRRYHSWRSAVVAKVMEKRRNSVAKQENVVPQVVARVTSPQLCVKRARKDAIEIFNDPGRSSVFEAQDRYDAMTRSVCALLFAHVGFSHITTNAMNLVADVVQQFIMQMGSSLCVVRENLDKALDADVHSDENGRLKTTEERIEEYRIICESGPKGSIQGLVYYVKCELPRIMYRVKDAEKRLEHQVLCDKFGAVIFRDPEELKLIEATVRAELANEPTLSDDKLGMKGQDAPVSEEDVKLDGEPFMLGYLCESVRLDVLGGITVPARAVYGRDAFSKDGVANGRIEKAQRSAMPKNNGASLQSTSTSSALIASSKPVKSEAKVADMDDGQQCK